MPAKKIQINTKLKDKTVVITVLSVVIVASALIVASTMPLGQNIRGFVSSIFTPQSDVDAYIPGRLLIKFKDNVLEKDQKDLLNKWGFSVKGEISPIKVKIINVPEKAEEALVRALSHNPRVEFVEVDALIPPLVIPNDPSYPQQWHLPKINTPVAWDTTQGQNVLIAIADTAIDKDHGDLLANLRNDLGWNFYHNDNNYDAYSSATNPYYTPYYYHGTAVAGAAAAVGNNGRQVAGVAHQTKIIPMRVADTNGYGCVSCMANSIAYAVENGAKAINFSFDMCDPSSYSTIKLAAENALSRGMLTIIGAGNRGTRVSYNPNDAFICISGTYVTTSGTEARASWSSYGNYVDLAAPGLNIVTTAFGGAVGPYSGTSLSAPVATGVAALVFSANPSLTATQVRQILFNTAYDLGTAGWDEVYGWGRVDAAAAVNCAIDLLCLATAPDTTSPTVSITSPLAGATVSGLIAINATASDNVGVANVKLYLDGNLASSDSASPYSFTWDTATIANGSHTIQVKAYDQAGNEGLSSIINVTVANVADTVAPNLTISSPADGSVISSNFTISATASDNVGVKEINIYLDGALVNACYNTTSCSHSVNMKRNPLSVGNHLIMATAFDVNGNSTTKEINITIQTGSKGGR